MKHSRGQRNLYEKMLRMVALHKRPKASAGEIDAMMEVQHDFYKWRHNGGKSTKNLSVQDFHSFYENCQRDSIEMFGISGMEEDSKEFDHGGK